MPKKKPLMLKVATPGSYKKGDSGGTERQFLKIGRNDLCPCGSGKKYKKCCLGEKLFKKSGLKTHKLPGK